MNTQEKIDAAGKKKEEGNALFKAGRYERASKRYETVYMKIQYTILPTCDMDQLTIPFVLLHRL